MAEASYSSSGSYSTKQQERARSEVINEKLNVVMKFASTSLTRAKQFTVEKLGRADSITSYGSDFDSLSVQIDQIKLTTERVVVNVESMIQPNPGIRLESKVYSKLDRPKPHRTSPHNELGVELLRAGNEFGPETQYGGYLVRCGLLENKIAAAEETLQGKVLSEFITPLKAFLEVDIKNVLKERRILNTVRLDLDACKTNVKKAQSDEKLQQAESELHLAQASFDMQFEKVLASMNKIVKTHVNNLGHIRSLMSILKAYHLECLSHFQDIDSNIGRSIDSAQSDKAHKQMLVNGIMIDSGEARKGRVLYDYDATSTGELTVLSDQILMVYPIDDDDEFVIGEIDGKFGKVPLTYIEFL